MATQIDYTRVTPNIDIQAARNGIEIDVSKRGLRGPRGEQGPGVGETVATVTSSRGMWPLRRALATGTARVVAMGDSKTEGAGVETVDQRWLDQLMGTLRARYAPDGDQGLGYLPAYYATFYGFPSAPTTAGSAVTVGNGGGLGNRSRHLQAGGSVTWTVPAWTAGVPLLVHWTQHPGHGDLEVVTGGTVRGTIVTGGSTTESKVTAVTIPAGTTSITVRHKSGTGTGNAARVEGIVHRTATTGVTIYDGARSGAKLVDYSQGLVNDGAPLSDDWHFQALAAVQPHAVILAFGANDQASRTPDQWGTDLRTVVDKAKAAAPGAGIIVLHGAQRTEDVTADPMRVLRFEAAARAAVGADPDVTILYESTLWKPTAGVDYTSSDPSGWLADTVHTGPEANAQIARYLAAQITAVDTVTDTAEVASDAARAAAAPAVTAAQEAQTTAQAAQAAASSSATDAQQAQLAAQNAASLVDAPASEIVSTVVSRMLVDATAHGVVGDGATNNSAALTALIASVSAAGGGVIVLPVGIYVCIGGVTGASNVTVRGADRDGTIIRKSGSNSTWLNTGESTNFRIENLTIDGNDSVTTRGVTFTSGATDCTLDHVTVKNMPTFALDCMGTTEGITITGCRFVDCSTAVRISSSTSRLLVDGNTFTNWQDSAIYVSGTASVASSDVTISNNTVRPHKAGTPAAAIRQPIRFHGEDSNLHRNIVVKGNVVTGRYTNHADTLNPGSADLISLHRCAGFEVSGNTVRGGGDVGITIAQGCRNGRVFGNLAEDNDTVGLCLGSAGSPVPVSSVTVVGNTFRNNALDHADTGGQTIDRSVERAKSSILAVQAQDCVIDGNVIEYPSGHPRSTRYAITWRECERVHIGAIGTGNKSTGHTAAYYSDTPASTGMTTTGHAELAASPPNAEAGRFVIAGIPVIVGNTVPEGVVTAPRGAMYLRTGGAAGDQIYYKNQDGTALGWRASSQAPGQNATNLGNAAHPINTSGKFKGVCVFNNTSNRPVWASNGGPTDPWFDAMGTAVITPS